MRWKPTGREVIVVAALLTAFGAETARAQDKPRVGLVMGYPTSAGVLWQVTDSVALRPELSLARMSGEGKTAGSSTTSSSTSWSLGVGASALFYLAPREGLRPYVSPRFSYTRNSASAQPVLGVSASENWSDNYSVAVSFGVEYALGRRVSVFGELGGSYTRQTSAYTSSLPNVLGSESTANTVSTRSAVGVVFYF